MLSQSPPGSTAARQVPAVEVEVGSSQVPLAEQSVMSLAVREQGLPASAKLITSHVAVCEEQNVPAAASQLPEVQTAPASSGCAHVPFLHASVRLQGRDVLSHASPALPGATQLPALLHKVPLGQFESARHESPAVGGAPQAPQLESLGMLQYALWH